MRRRDRAALYLRMAWRGQRRAVDYLGRALLALVQSPEPPVDDHADHLASTADWHVHPAPSHPSQLCRCPGRISEDDAARVDANDLPDHEPGCPWVAARCRTCCGHGWCPRCGGDGIEPTDADRTAADAAGALDGGGPA